MKGKEANLQSECIKWFRLQYPDFIIFAIPNGGTRNVIEAANLKRQGVLPGVADLFVPISNGVYFGLFIEMKIKGGKQTESQKWFEQKVIGRAYNYVVCHSFDEFRNTIENYFKGKK